MPDLTGAQLGAVIQEVYLELTRVPFIIYSGREKEWVDAMINEVSGISSAFRKNYRGYLAKSAGSEAELVELVKAVLKGIGTRSP